MFTQKHWVMPLLATTVLGLSPSTHAQETPEDAALAALEEALPGTLMNNPFTTVWTSNGSEHRSKIVKSADVPGGMAYQVYVKKRLEKPWGVAVVVPVEKDIKEGDTIEATVWMRATKPLSGSDTGRVDIQVVRNREPYDNVFSENIRIGKEWALQSVRGTAGRNFPTGQTNFGVNLGYGKQTIEFGPVYIVKLNDNSDPNAEGDQPSPKPVESSPADIDDQSQ